MNIRILVFFVLVSFFSCGNKETSDNKTKVIDAVATIEKAQGPITILDYDGLEPLLKKKDDKIHIINFWATWCKPCVDELPYFEKVGKDFKDKNVEVTLVSLDFPKQIANQLIPFIKNNKLQSQVVVLDDPNQNKWINAIDPSWTGSIPATIIYNKNDRAFYEQSFDEETLLKELEKFIN